MLNPGPSMEFGGKANREKRGTAAESNSRQIVRTITLRQRSSLNSSPPVIRRNLLTLFPPSLFEMDHKPLGCGKSTAPRR